MKTRLSHVATLITLLAVCVFTPVVHADTTSGNYGDFTVENFDADYTLGTTDPQGTLTVHEQLTVNFPSSHHGIFRALPKTYNSRPLHLHVLSVARDGIKEQYSTSSSNGNKVLKIGSPDLTISGLHHYDISYTYSNVIRFVGTGAELDWNVNGTGWQQDMLHVSARLHVPISLQGKLTSSQCFTGSYGSKQSDCLVVTNKGVTTYTTTRALTAGETLTFNETAPSGYFTKPTLKDNLQDYGTKYGVAIALPLLALIIAGGAWYRIGRDAKGKGTIVPEYGPPSNLKPAEVDVLLHNKLTKNAISATIIDLAIRKHLRIQESESKGLLGIGKHKEYTFVRLAPPANDSLSNYEATVLSGLFASGQQVEIASLKDSFYKTLQEVQKAVPKSLTAQGFFRKNPASVSIGWHVLGVVILFCAFFFLNLGIITFIGGILAGLVVLVFATLMPSRTSQGAQAKDAAEGLKLYLNTAEKDRIAMLQSPDAPYASQSSEPVKTVELFEKLLPYAMILGVEQQWAKQFEGIYTTPPDWYGGNWSTFNALYLTNSLSNSMSAMNNSFAAPASSGSGGFSGGGGGGGGGGGW